MVEDITAGEFPHEVGGGVYDLGRAGKDLRSIAVQPEDLRADRLARQRLIAVLDQRLFAYLCGEFLYLGGGACINAIKHCVHQRLANRINGQHTRADGTARHRPDVSEPLSDISCRLIAVKSFHQSSRGRCSAQPACGTIMRWGRLASATVRPLSSTALARISADINAEIMAHRGIKGSAP